MKLLGTVPAKTMKSAAAVFQRDDVIYGRLRPYLNKVCKPGFEGLCSSEFIVLPDQPQLRSSYLQYRLNSTDFTRFASSLNAGDRPRVDFEQIGEFEIELPQEAEQLRIVAKIEELFSDLDAGIASLERARARLKRYRASVLKAAVEGRLTEKWRAEQKAKGIAVKPAAKLLERILAERRKNWETAQLKKFAEAGKIPPKGWQCKYPDPAAPGNGELPELPKGWCWASLDQLSQLITSGSRDWSKYYGRGPGVFVMAQNVRPWRPDFSEIQLVDPPIANRDRVRSKIAQNDLLVTIVGANTGQFCRVSEKLQDYFVCQSVALIRPVFELSSAFLNAWFNSEENGQRYFAKCIYGQGRPHLGFDELRVAPVALPTEGEQAEILQQVEAALSSITHAETEIEHSLARAARLRQAILKRAFEGRLV